RASRGDLRARGALGPPATLRTPGWRPLRRGRAGRVPKSAPPVAWPAPEQAMWSENLSEPALSRAWVSVPRVLLPLLLRVSPSLPSAVTAEAHARPIGHKARDHGSVVHRPALRLTS